MRVEHRATEAAAALKALGPNARLLPDLPYADVLRQPHEYLGSFASLRSDLRGELLKLHHEEEAIRTLSSGVLSRTLVHGGAWLGRVFYALERWAGHVRAGAPEPMRVYVEAVRRWLRRRARESTHVPFALRRWLSRAGARLQLRAGRRDLTTILRARGFDARDLGYTYLEGLRQIRGCESVLKRDGFTYAELVGVDFVQSDGLYWFLEANYNPALMDARLALYEADEDPWVSGLVACALTRGFRRLVIYGYRPFSPAHAAALIAGGQRSGIEVSIVDDLFSARHSGHRRAWLMENGGRPGALVVRAKGFDVLFDRVMLSKQLTRRVVEPWRDQLARALVQLPRLIPRGGQVSAYRPDSRYPNIVAKVDGLDRGAGVSFYKLPHIPRELAREADYFEEYRVPDSCSFKIVRGRRVELPGDPTRAWKIRSYALLSPEGVEYLSSIKVISGRAVPSSLPDGKVAEKNIYLATINEGGVYSAVTSAEDDAYRRAVTVVGDALLAWLNRKYAGQPVQQTA